jgi:hypothetical protein
MKYFACLFLLFQSIACLNVAGQASSLESKEINSIPFTNASAMASAAHPISIDLQQAISLYADFKKRTVLEHPQLGKAKVFVRVDPKNEAESATALEEMFKERGIATILDGDNFVMIVPSALTNTVSPRASSLAATNHPIPTMSVNFVSVPISMVLEVYADYVGHKIVNVSEAPQGPLITFTQTTPLSKAEICYAFETLLAWQNIRVVPEGNDLKWEYIRAR